MAYCMYCAREIEDPEDPGYPGIERWVINNAVVPDGGGSLYESFGASPDSEACSGANATEPG